MSQFKYFKEKLLIENTSVLSIARKNKTPFYLYSEKQIKENYLNFAKTFKNISPLICFAAKHIRGLIFLKILTKFK